MKPARVDRYAAAGRRDLAAAAVAQAAARAESFANAAPRRVLNGHTANCPNRLKGRFDDHRCGLCHAETSGAGR